MLGVYLNANCSPRRSPQPMQALFAPDIRTYQRSLDELDLLNEKYPSIRAAGVCSALADRMLPSWRPERERCHVRAGDHLS